MLPMELVVGMQLECAKVKLVCLHCRRFVRLDIRSQGRRRRPYQGERRVRILRPDREIAGRDGQPSEAEHVAARLRDVSDLLPGTFIDDVIDEQFCLPCEVRGPARHLPMARSKTAPHAPASRTYRVAGRRSRAPALAGSTP